MQHPDTLRLRIIINVEPEKVWKALTKSEYIQYYFHGCEVESAWQENDTIAFNLEMEGQKKTLVHGKLLEIEKNKVLRHSLFPSDAKYPDIPANHIVVCYELIDLAGQTELIITQTGFQNAQDGEKRFEESIKGWDYSLPLLKEISESIPNL